MTTKRNIHFAAGLLAASLAVPSVALAQTQATDAEPAAGPAVPMANKAEPIEVTCPCACDWDCCTGTGVCDIFDFLEFQNAFVAGDPCAIDQDTSTGVGVGDIFDFLAFQYQFINKMFGNC